MFRTLITSLIDCDWSLYSGSNEVMIKFIGSCFIDLFLVIELLYFGNFGGCHVEINFINGFVMRELNLLF